MHRFRIIPFLAGLMASAGCQHTPAGTAQLAPVKCVEVGTVTPHGVWSTKQALARAGIPAFTDGSRYSLPFRILVPPEYRERAVVVLREVERRPSIVGYGITHE